MALDNEFWNEWREKLFSVMFPIIRDTVVGSAEIWLKDLTQQTSIGVDWALVNQAAVKYAQDYTYELVKGINATSRAATADAVSAWIESGLPLDDLIGSLAPMYGSVRADMIAVTEVTRAFAEGQNILWKESGVVSGYNVFTAEDDNVDEICQIEAAGGPYELSDNSHRPPFHINCRCWLQPVVNIMEAA